MTITSEQVGEQRADTRRDYIAVAVTLTISLILCTMLGVTGEILAPWLEGPQSPHRVDGEARHITLNP